MALAKTFVRVGLGMQSSSVPVLSRCSDVRLLCRLGVLIAQNNPMLVKAMAPLSLFMKVSAPADCLFCALLEEPSLDGSERYRDWFIKENRRRMVSNYRCARDWLEARGFNVAPSNAGHFMWVDLGSKFGWKTVDDEEEGFCRLFDAGLYIVSATQTKKTLHILSD
jgi:1-aminocyclopropane-1-carboxylate synthase